MIGDFSVLHLESGITETETSIPQNKSLTGEFQKGVSLGQMGEFGYERNKVGCKCRVAEVSNGYQKKFFRIAGQQVHLPSQCRRQDLQSPPSQRPRST